MGKFWKWVASIGVAVAGLGSAACVLAVIDEPEMPKSMIK